MEKVRMEGEPVTVPAPVLAGIEAVQRSGLTNLLDRPAAARIAQALGYDTAADWIRANPTPYAEGVFRGFRLATVNWDAPLIAEEAVEGFHHGPGEEGTNGQ